MARQSMPVKYAKSLRTYVYILLLVWEGVNEGFSAPFETAKGCIALKSWVSGLTVQLVQKALKKMKLNVGFTLKSERGYTL